MKSKRNALALMLALCLILGGCSSGKKKAAEPATITLPIPSPAATDQIIGEQKQSAMHDVTIYNVAADGVTISSTTRSVTSQEDESLAETVLREMLFPEEGSSLRLISADTKLLSVESACGVVTVNLSIDAAITQSDSELLLLETLIANTLLSLDGVIAVNLLIGDRSCSISRLPIGAQSVPTDNTAAAYAQIEAEADQLLNAGSGSIQRNVILYFPAKNGAYLLPELRRVNFPDSDFANLLIAELQAGPQAKSCCFSAIPGNLELLSGDPILRATEAGERVLELNLSSTLLNYLAFSGIEPWQLYGSVLLTLCSFIPEIDAVRFSIEGQVVDNCSIAGRNTNFADGLMRRNDYSACIGSSARICFGSDATDPAFADVAVSASTERSPRLLLTAMITANTYPPEGFTNLFPEGIYADDILGVSVINGVARVNLSGNFYARCQGLNEASERRLIYGMVNTLCNIEDIGAVHFLVEGMAIDSLAQSIYINTDLLPIPLIFGE